MQTDQLVQTPIFGGMLRKPTIWGIPSDLWYIAIFVATIALIEANPIVGVVVFGVMYGLLYLVYLWDEDAFSMVSHYMKWTKNPLKQKMGCNGYVGY
jgi:type IV secretory pathway VirB3-like protein